MERKRDVSVDLLPRSSVPSDAHDEIILSGPLNFVVVSAMVENDIATCGVILHVVLAGFKFVVTA